VPQVDSGLTVQNDWRSEITEPGIDSTEREI
jgi:hypothetical protein